MQLQAISVLMLLLISAVSACTAPKPAPSLNFHYTPNTQVDKGNRMTVAMINPDVTGTPANDNSDKEPGPADTIPYAYTNDYALRLKKSMLYDFENILKAKGFLINQSFDSTTQVSAEEKQKIDLFIAPTFDGGPLVTNNQTIYHYPTGTVLITNTGTIRLIGTVTVEFIEPQSMEKIMIKTFNIDSLGLSNSAEYQDQADALEKCMELLNEVYPVLMAKVEKEISKDTLQKLLNNIKNRNNSR
jgi:hypothetical protein